MQNSEQINQNIIPYVPIADRVKAKTEKSLMLCKQLFEIVDRCVQAQFSFNHDTARGHLSISPDQINDLLNELAKNDQSDQAIDIKMLNSRYRTSSILNSKENILLPAPSGTIPK